MSLDDSLKFLERLKMKCEDTSDIQTEEATKHSLILPMISALGYDIFDNNEVRPEYIADVGTKKGEKVDYVILQNGQPMILIEAKQVGTPLRNKIDQLFRYFVTTTAKIAILTDGVKYLFFTDSQKENIMDDEPYMTIDMKEGTHEEFERVLAYHKDRININNVMHSINLEKYIEASKNLVDDLVSLRPPNWILRKMADDCGISEPNDSELARILNKQLSLKVKVRESNNECKDVSEVKSENKEVQIERYNGVAKINDSLFSNTKGIKVIDITVGGHSVCSEEVRPSWRNLYRSLLEMSVVELGEDQICDKLNAGRNRKYIDTEEFISGGNVASIPLKGTNLHLMVKLAGKDIVKRAIEVCELFGKVEVSDVEIHYERYK